MPLAHDSIRRHTEAHVWEGSNRIQIECTNEHGEVRSGIGELVQDERKNGRVDEDVQTTPQTGRTTLVRCCMQSDC